jgi:hypothetical protein
MRTSITRAGFLPIASRSLLLIATAAETGSDSRAKPQRVGSMLTLLPTNPIGTEHRSKAWLLAPHACHRGVSRRQGGTLCTTRLRRFSAREGRANTGRDHRSHGGFIRLGIATGKGQHGLGPVETAVLAERSCAVSRVIARPRSVPGIRRAAVSHRGGIIPGADLGCTDPHWTGCGASSAGWRAGAFGGLRESEDRRRPGWGGTTQESAGVRQPACRIGNNVIAAERLRSVLDLRPQV